MYESADAAESAFYVAFERGDITAMMSVWADNDSIVCVHPLQRPLYGIEEVQRGWEQIFTGEPSMEFRLTRLHEIVSESTAVHIVEENILVGEDREPHAPVLVTNIYQKGPSGWRMVLHHASPAPRGPLRAPNMEPGILH
ncbi:MAG: nuclear transport factor 2 family protein [Gammaproteobacteria bacterium]